MLFIFHHFVIHLLCVCLIIILEFYVHCVYWAQLLFVVSCLCRLAVTRRASLVEQEPLTLPEHSRV
jgi:hypothetical protein